MKILNLGYGTGPGITPVIQAPRSVVAEEVLTVLRHISYEIKIQSKHLLQLAVEREI